MTFQHWTKQEIKNELFGYETLRTALDKASKNKTQILYSNSIATPCDDTVPEQYASNLQSILIGLTGRFCENYASDLIATLSKLDTFLRSEPITENGRYIIGVGIRENGVDGNSFIANRLFETTVNEIAHPYKVYRKLLAIDIVEKVCNTEVTRTIKLVDITQCTFKMADVDYIFKEASTD